MEAESSAQVSQDPLPLKLKSAEPVPWLKDVVLFRLCVAETTKAIPAVLMGFQDYTQYCSGGGVVPGIERGYLHVWHAS